jgi:hypothetical protein
MHDHSIKTKAISACAIFLCLPFQTLPLLTPLSASATSNIIIEEVSWAGSSTSIADEWVELANLGDATTTIGGWIIKGAGTNNQSITLPSEAVISPHGTYLVANYAETNEKSSLSTHVQFATTAIGISNDDLRITLTDANSVEIDLAGDGTSPPAGLTSPYASMIRADALISGDQKSAWASAESSVGFKDGVTDAGTPGFCDLCRTSEEAPVEVVDDSTEDAPLPTDDTTTATTTTVIIEPINLEDSVTSTTIEIVPEEIESSTTSTTVSTETEATSTSSNATTQQGAHAPVFLNEIVSNPTTGSEWIELEWPNGTTSTDREILIYDSQGKIATVATGTVMTASPYLLVQLSSARLNNTGDTVSIREMDGTIADQTTVPSLDKGESWAMNPESNTWESTETITPASENVIYRAPTNSTSTSSSSSSVSSSSSSSPSSATTSSTSTSSSYIPTTCIPVFLNEVVSNPSGGPEWVELYFPNNATSTDRVLILRDSKNKIKTIPAQTILTLPHYLVIPLSSSKLNNGGEALSLHEEDETLIETTTLPKLAKGTSWIKTSDGAWEITEMLTPAGDNQSSLDEDESSSDSLLTSDISTETVVGEKAEDDSEDMLDEIFSSAYESTATKISSASLKKSSSKTTETITSYAFIDMFNEDMNAVRVRISGMVASVPKLFGASHVFILQNEDGRGIIVYVPTHLHIPSFGSTVRVDGTIAVTDYGPQIKMKKTDIWMSMATGTAPIPREVDLLAPSSEDAWSLVAIQGTVTAVGATSFTIETEDAISITVSAPSIAGFRTKRLVKGDTVQTVGLLNIKKLTPTMIIRTADDVTLVKHAEDTVTAPSTSTQTKSRFPDWAPFASAGVAIVGTGGAKRLREAMRKRTLKKLMEKAKETEGRK